MDHPRSNTYDMEFVRANMMGPNALKLLEELTDSFDFKSGDRVLDLGCGMGLTSIFLAREFGVNVFATDLWISATENHERFKAAGLADRIIPIHAEAHDLPYANGYFDSVVSVDAFQYFGADDTFLDGHLAPLVKPGGMLGVAVPGFVEEYGQNIPADISQYVKPEYEFHSCDWWQKLWRQSKLVESIESRSLPGCTEAWSDWLTSDNEYAISDREMIKAEGGRYFNFVGLTARRI